VSNPKKVSFIALTRSSTSKSDRLVFNQNQLVGAIPSEIGLLAKLEYLVFGQNFLTGNLPTELGGLTALETLDFSYNNLSGTIPTQICQLWDYMLFQMSLTGCTAPEQAFGGLQCPAQECCHSCHKNTGAP